ncbi:hypothetical protein H2198_003404 [Neophaeococcomyces mojaviensis]|uniref:Uncharacterized protein n=1 Tax=Neophaeococcomyces mojaviensis TaxID=3383035 RepID=A0ACC3ABP3_9EURO|nr:hypothetical protein H2198_003404 [Knufia sp. JES_112]
MPPRNPPWSSTYSPLPAASYLADLRNNRPTRPTGSRPLPTRPSLPTQDENLPPRAGSALSLRSPDRKLPEQSIVSKEQKLAHRASMPTSNSYSSLGSQKGRPLVPSPNNATRKVSPPAAAAGTPYKESSTRVKEREEAHALREALEKLDQGDDEQRIHDAAKQEAADLVWRHQNPQLAEVEKVAAYRNPDLKKPKYGELRHAKQSEKPVESESTPNSRSASAGSTSSQDSKRHRLPWLRKRPKPEPSTAQPKIEITKEADANTARDSRGASGKRHISSGSSKGVFRNPEDEIYEEAEEMDTTTAPTPQQALPLRSRQTKFLQQEARPLPEKSYTMPLPDKKKVDRFEIWKNPPTQSRNAGYTARRALPQVPSEEEEETDNTDSPRTRALEIRGEDIRAATSMRKSDRSPKLPTPTAVSDRPGRPIVSFDPRWRPGTESPRNSQDIERPQVRTDGAVSYPVTPSPPAPEITIMEVPTINVTDETSQTDMSTRPLPQINLSDKSTPSKQTQEHKPGRPLPRINLHDAPASPSVPSISIQQEQSKGRPLPSIKAQPDRAAARPLPSHTQSSPSKLPPTRPTQSEIAARVPWLSRTPTTTSTSTVTCGACSLPISGRIVTASGASTKSQKARFHPECFTCHHCSTGLECISFYPEPETARLERLQAALPHLDPEDPQVHALAQSNEDLHFFCHLDYHELFSPRCHSCKTPIEGAIVLALGRHYHPDHFFCAECGDPFSQESPFVEHNSYPYCVRCHTKRTSARCRGCKQQILTDMTIEALGGKWHDECFVCCDCGGEFGDEGRFFVREVEVELTEKEKRKGYGPKIEERAACQVCEEKRVKNVNHFL